MKKILIIVLAFFSLPSGCGLKRGFNRDCSQALWKANQSENSIAAYNILDSLPTAVKRYITITNTLNEKPLKAFRANFSGGIRKDSISGWMKLKSTQLNTIEQPSRMFFMKTRMLGLPVRGYHFYEVGRSYMDVRLFSVFRVQYKEGDQMEAAETVTFFNDLCLFAPAALTDKRITWSEIRDSSVRATFTRDKITVSAILIFNRNGELSNFISDDRYVLLKDNTMKKVRWSTPVSSYRNIKGYNLPSEASAVWSFPEGDFVYGKFILRDIVYNPTQ